MSIVIIGGHDRMVCQYKKICREYKYNADIIRCHTSSKHALKEILESK